MIKKLFLLNLVTLLGMPVANACDSSLQNISADAKTQARFQRDCKIQDRFAQVRMKFESLGLQINDVAEYKSMRFIDRKSWEFAKIHQRPPNAIYPPAPATWNVWHEGIEKLFQNPLQREHLIKNPVSLENLSQMNQILLSNGKENIKDIETDQRKKNGEYRIAGDDGASICAVEKLNYAVIVDQSRDSLLVVQKRWEKQIGQSFANIVAQAKGPLASIATIGTPVRSMGPGCGKDGSGFLISYVRSDQVVNQVSWITIFLNTTLQRFQKGQAVIPPIELSALVQKWFVSIHPFADGNGRTSRAIQDMILAHFALPFAPAGDLLNDVIDDYDVYIENTYAAIEKSVSHLEGCAKELQNGQQISFSCRPTSELNR